ncbi:MAG: hypothetical protein LBJ44_11960 [Propionibacteriaceae bacterium]|jgi:hypothetical protein|nr:hypothetical protein [Propionibacteriaceae bacterium]
MIEPQSVTPPTNLPVVVGPKRDRRRPVGVFFSVALATALMAGLTLAAFTDSEHGALDASEQKPGYGTGSYNIQISNVASGAWKDTTLLDGSASDNTTADVEAPIQLGNANGHKLIPGDQDSWVTVDFYVRNDEASTVNSILNFHLIKSEAKTTDAALLSALRFDVAFSGTGLAIAKLEDKTFTELNDVDAFKFVTSAAPGAVYKVSITIKLPNQGNNGANNNDFQNKVAHLIASIEGASTSA